MIGRRFFQHRNAGQWSGLHGEDTTITMARIPLSIVAVVEMGAGLRSRLVHRRMGGHYQRWPDWAGFLCLGPDDNFILSTRAVNVKDVLLDNRSQETVSDRFLSLEAHHPQKFAASFPKIQLNKTAGCDGASPRRAGAASRCPQMRSGSDLGWYSYRVPCRCIG